MAFRGSEGFFEFWGDEGSVGFFMFFRRLWKVLGKGRWFWRVRRM